MEDVIPALHQSTYEMMACPESYVAQEIEGVEMPPNVHSDRGNQFHHALALYARHCAAEGIAQDWQKFDQLAQAVGGEAGEILDEFRDSYIVDYEHVFETELRLMLDEDFQPTVTDATGRIHPEPFPGLEYSGRPAAHGGTLDLVSIIDSNKGKIDDYKSHFMPFSPDTYQSKLYPVLLMQHLPSLSEVEFELIFARFRNVRRSVTYRREDLPALMKEMERARRRQKLYHILAKEDGRPDIQAIPGNHCVYCPKLVDLTCPWREFNPYTAVSPEARLKFAVWAGQALAANREPLKAEVTACGPITFEDANGKIHSATIARTEGYYFPAVQTMNALLDWNNASGGDPTLFNGLRISSTQLKPKLKAKKRAILDQALHDIRVAETSVSFKITTADGAPVDDGAPKWGAEEDTW